MPVPPTPPTGLDQTLAAGFAEAIRHYEAGAPLAAAILFTAVLEHAPDHADSLRLRGLALVRAGRAREALDDLRRARILAPGDPLSHLHYGIGLQEAGQHARAAAMFRRASVMWPDSPVPWINLSSALLSLGHPQAARAASRRGLRLALPGDAAPVYALGLAELAAEDLVAARGAFAEAVRRQPDFAPAWVNLVLVLVRGGQIAFALRAIERGRAACPGSSALASAEAAFGVLAGDQDRALGQLRAIIARDPSCIAARLNLANALLVDGAAREALSVLDGRAPAGRDGAHWRAHRSLALLQLRRDREAAQELDAIAGPVGDAEILIVWRRLNLAVRAGQTEAARGLAERMAILARDEGAALYEHRIIAHFELAGFRRQHGEDALAFHHWSAGHALLAVIQPFSRPDYAAFFDAAAIAYDGQRLQHGPRAANNDASPVFIVGLPRSGTSLTEQVLAAHEQVHGGGERTLIHQILTQIGGRAISAQTVRTAAALGAAELTALASRYLDDVRAETQGARFITDKMPGNALHLGLIATLFPRAKVVMCRRDLRDIGLSIFQLRFFGNHPYAHELAGLGWYMSAHERLMDHWRAVLPIPIATVDLADWVHDFDGTLARLLGFLGLPPDPACERFYEQGRRVRTASAHQVRQPINGRGLGRWQRFAAELAPMIAELSPPSDP